MQIDRTLLSQIISERTQALALDSLTPDDWELLMKEAQAEGVGPLLYWALNRSGKLPRLPQVVANCLRAMYFSTRMNNEQILQELAMLTRRFDEAGIPTVALKGVCFALTIYPDLGLRPMVDLDLLIPASKLSAAVQIAKNLGYVEIVPETFAGLRKLLGDEISLKKTSAPFSMLELHNSLLVDKSFTYAVPVDWFWSQTEPITGMSSTRVVPYLLMLSPTAQVLYACAHAVLKHGGESISLRWLYDLDRLICVYLNRIHWELLLRQAKLFQWSSALDAAFSQTVNLFNTPIPDHVLAEVSRSTDRHRKLIELKQNRPATRVLEEYQQLSARKWYGKLIMMLGLIAPSPAYMRWRYGLKSDWALPGYYLYRWGGILRDAVQTLIHLIRKSRLGEDQP